MKTPKTLLMLATLTLAASTPAAFAALRVELKEEGLPISMTLVKPASIDTPFFDKAKAFLGVEPQPIPPVYAPDVAANVILSAAEHLIREVIAGGAAAKLSVARFAPRLADLYMLRWTFDGQKTDKPAGPDRPNNLYAPVTVCLDGPGRGTRASRVY